MTKQKLFKAAKEAGLNVKAYQSDEDDNILWLIVGKKYTTEKIKWNPFKGKSKC